MHWISSLSSFIWFWHFAYISLSILLVYQSSLIVIFVWVYYCDCSKVSTFRRKCTWDPSTFLVVPFLNILGGNRRRLGRVWRPLASLNNSWLHASFGILGSYFHCVLYGRCDPLQMICCEICSYKSWLAGHSVSFLSVDSF